MTSPAEVRDRVVQLREDLARSDGQESALEGEIADLLKRLRKTLSCKAGQEKKAIQKLRNKVETSSEKLEELLCEAERIRDGLDEDDDEDA